MKITQTVLEINESNHDEFLKNNFSVLNFFSEWQMNCLMALPVIESVAEEFFGKIFFGNVNVDDCETLAKRYGVEKVPCVIFFKNGEVIERIEKFFSEEFLREKICCLM